MSETIIIPQSIVSGIKALCDTSHQIAISKGWWSLPRTPAECIALMHSELSEMLEAYRTGNPADEHCPFFSSAEIELADLFIRGGDFAKYSRLRLGLAIDAKMTFNQSRPYRHGKKL